MKTILFQIFWFLYFWCIYLWGFSLFLLGFSLQKTYIIYISGLSLLFPPFFVFKLTTSSSKGFISLVFQYFSGKMLKAKNSLCNNEFVNYIFKYIILYSSRALNYFLMLFFSKMLSFRNILNFQTRCTILDVFYE